MARVGEVPRFVVHIVPEAGGYRPLVALKSAFVYRGDACPDLATARQSAALFVVGRPEEEREIVWAVDEPFWAGGVEVGRISVEPFSPGGCCTTGWVRPTCEAAAFTALMAEGLEHSRRWATRPDHEAAAERCLDNGVALAELGLAVGYPPRSVESLNVMGDWHMFLCLEGPWATDAETGAAADPRGM
jgi:hypothetical protein